MEDKTEFQEMNERERTFIHWKKIDIHASIILLATLYDLGFERETYKFIKSLEQRGSYILREIANRYRDKLLGYSLIIRDI